MHSPLFRAAAACIVAAFPAAAGETVNPEELVRRPFDIQNSGHAPILCRAEIAHWFATDLGRIAPGENGRLDLRFDTLSGTWATMNAHGEALPVERAWCGVEGRTYETRWSLYLGRDQRQPQQLDCRPEGAGLVCR